MDRGVNGVVVATMGSGKSIAQAEVAADRLTKLPDNGVLVVTAPRKSLVGQLAKTFRERLGEETVGAFYTGAKQADRRVVICCNASAPKLAEVLRANGRTHIEWIADECHGTESERIIEACAALAPVRRCGFTATPYRSDSRERLSLFDELLYRYSPGDALRDEVIVKYAIRTWEGAPNTSIDRACLAMILEHGDGPGLVNALTTDGAEHFAAFLDANGVRAAAIHSKMSDRLQEERIEALRLGEFRCLVHVNMLAEGVDLPWLRWLCLRRDVKARVRFAQEVGRVLRAFPGKDHAILLDPHDLFGRHELVYAEALGWEPDPEPEKAPEPKPEPEEERLPPPPPKAVIVRNLDAWSRQLLMALRLEGFGLAGPGGDLPAGIRTRPPSPKQRDTIANLAWIAQRLPEPHRACVRGAARALALRMGNASDLISLLLGLKALVNLRRHPRQWVWQPSIQVAELDPDVLAAQLRTEPQDERPAYPWGT